VSFHVSLLADVPAAIEQVARLRWREWGHAPEPEDFQFWLETSTQEAGRDAIPVTFVALDGADVVGAVGLDEFDIDERHDTSPWITGTIVRPDARQRGVGRALMSSVELWAAQRGIREAWVATEIAADFYRKCGWTLLETIDRVGDDVHVLHKRFS
jgi:GNAT superfamily N-acetyltransferase